MATSRFGGRRLERSQGGCAKAAATVLLFLALLQSNAAVAHAKTEAELVFHEGDSPCTGQFEICKQGDCAIDESLCGTCKPGQLVCPISNVCLDGGTDAYESCPGLNQTHLDWTLSIDERVDLMIQSFTVEERAAQLSNFALAVPEQGVPRFQWLADNLHGVRQSNRNVEKEEEEKPLQDFFNFPANGTTFGSGPALGATWNPDLLREVGQVIAKESRALYNLEVQSGRRGWAPDSNNNVVTVDNGPGISVYSPNVNLARDPRWGRIAEVFTEDLHLMNKLSLPFVAGLQQGPQSMAGTDDSDTDTVMTLATCKHAAVYDVELSRQHYSANVGGRALVEFYLPSIEACTSKGRQAMCSYNEINGVPACAEQRLLDGAIRNRSGFDGFVVSDYDAWADLKDTYAVCKSYECAAAVGLKAGMDMEGGNQEVAWAIPSAIQQGLVNETLLNRAFGRVMRARLSLGTLDPPNRIKYNTLGAESVANQENLDLALKAAEQGLILLKNDRDTLPLAKDVSQNVLVVGYGATAKDVQLGPYTEGPAGSKWYLDKYVVSILEGVTAANEYGNVTYQTGCKDTQCTDSSLFNDAVLATYNASAVVFVLNLDGGIEHEGLDRWSMNIPDGQMQLCQQVRAALPEGTPMIGVLIHGGVVTLPPVWDHFDAVFDSFYPGIYGGQALGEALYGKINPSGKLPVTVYDNDAQLPQAIQQQDPYPSPNKAPYSMGLTYKYFTGQPFLKFGYGMSYTSFTYSDLEAPPASVHPCDPFNVSVTVTNTGAFDGDEIVQLYLTLPDSTVPAPQIMLGAFKRVSLKSGESGVCTLTVDPHTHFVVYEQNGDDNPFSATRMVEAGRRRIYVGGQQPGGEVQTLTSLTTVDSTVPLTSCPSDW